MGNENNTARTNKLQSLQLTHWVRAVRNGEQPSLEDPDTGETIPLPVPLARSDGGGLTFTLSAKGTATWILRYRTAGRMKELTIGNFPDVGLSDARKISREKRAQIDQSGDPAADKRRAKAKAMADWTITELIEDYRVKILDGLGNSTKKGYGRSLEKIAIRLGSLSVSQVSSSEIVELVESAKVPWSESRMLLTTARMLFKHACGRKLVYVNPCVGIELTALLGMRPAVRRRLMLTKAEIAVGTSGS